MAAMLAMVLATAVPAVAMTKTVTASPTATATAAASAQYAQYTLPSTGGPGPFSGALALGAGALLVGGGLVARRIVR